MAPIGYNGIMIERCFSPEFRRLLRRMLSGDLINIEPSLHDLLVAGVAALSREPVVWLVGERENPLEKGARLSQWLHLLGEESRIHFHLLPFEDPYINNTPGPKAIGSKARLLRDLHDGRRCLVITTLSALNIGLESPDLIGRFTLAIQRGNRWRRQDLLDRLLALDYRSCDLVAKMGDVSWRGSIVDIHPVDQEQPLRIELEGGEVVSLRMFDVNTQKSIRRIDDILIPANRYFETLTDINHYFAQASPELKPLLHWLGRYRLIFSDWQRLADEFEKLINHHQLVFDAAGRSRGSLTSVKHLFNLPCGPEAGLNLCSTYDAVTQEPELVPVRKYLNTLTSEDLHHLHLKQEEHNYHLVFCSRRDQLVANLDPIIQPVARFDGEIPVSFENQATRTLFIGHKPFIFVDSREVAPESKGEALLQKIGPDDLVVHKKHGVGRFAGFKRLGGVGENTEYLKIEYANREFLYVPVYQLDVLSKYATFEGFQPKLDRLGGATWRVKQNRARRSIIHFAKDLLELYALRKSIKGNVYERDAEMEDRLEREFPFLETDDQRTAIRETMLDLEDQSPMDRLVCGDVSFGKTEVAVRAAFRVIMAGRQVVMLCPTTILALQHFQTFKRRLEVFPIRLEMLSRMVPMKERKRIFQELKAGTVDMVIGTHLLLSPMVQFKNLGLYIIDEEQRFGVFQKEKLKKAREEIDVLSLSATPIPRTLSLSLAGLQDISVIRTPPIGRLAIKNYVGYFSKEIVMSAILKELDRDGQVFVVYNNIGKIYSFEEDLKKWLPELRTVVIHAKMRIDQIEKNLMAFIAKDYQVLISTTIIENGIDIPDVNTLIVLNADRFGLTQMYQLRGRIGRGNRQAYAYFLVQTPAISDKARSRLQAIREFTELGAGFKLAEFDLKLRGAGTLLGNRQHGHIDALGFDYYHQLLLKTVRELKGLQEKSREIEVKIRYPYSIDKQVIPMSMERVRLYKQILDAGDVTAIEEVKQELCDRYGHVHESIERIIFARLIRIFLDHHPFVEAEVYLNRLILRYPSAEPVPVVVSELISRFAAKETADHELTLYYDNYHQFIQELVAIDFTVE